jgi:hypothetical protein
VATAACRAMAAGGLRLAAGLVSRIKTCWATTRDRVMIIEKERD